MGIAVLYMMIRSVLLGGSRFVSRFKSVGLAFRVV
jgi:hypothetical protein